MSNTQLRIISAAVMALIVSICLFLGEKTTLSFIMVAGVLSTDEIYCNFLKKKRFAGLYFISQTLFAAPFIYLNFISDNGEAFDHFILASLVLNFFLIYYLFFMKMSSRNVIKVMTKAPFLAGIVLLLPFMSLTALFSSEKWLSWIAVILLVNFGMDTGAWFFGKNFGKRKLWPSVSPKKTIEGLLGGMLTSSVLGGLAFYFLFERSAFFVWPLFFMLGGVSQLGDLVQSKLKRQFGIKDSSSLIPGHGGVYDRIDSLLFLSPFFVWALKAAGRI